MSTENLTNLASARRAEPKEVRESQQRWAIERAIESKAGHHQDIVEAAQAFVDFVNGTNDAEIVRAARELADKVKSDSD